LDKKWIQADNPADAYTIDELLQSLKDEAQTMQEAVNRLTEFLKGIEQ